MGVLSFYGILPLLFATIIRVKYKSHTMTSFMSKPKKKRKEIELNCYFVHYHLLYYYFLRALFECRKSYSNLIPICKYEKSNTRPYRRMEIKVDADHHLL